jgi:hypothetical protein
MPIAASPVAATDPATNKANILLRELTEAADLLHTLVTRVFPHSVSPARHCGRI